MSPAPDLARVLADLGGADCEPPAAKLHGRGAPRALLEVALDVYDWHVAFGTRPVTFDVWAGRFRRRVVLSGDALRVWREQHGDEVEPVVGQAHTYRTDRRAWERLKQRWSESGVPHERIMAPVDSMRRFGREEAVAVRLTSAAPAWSAEVCRAYEAEARRHAALNLESPDDPVRDPDCVAAPADHLPGTVAPDCDGPGHPDPRGAA